MDRVRPGVAVAAAVRAAHGHPGRTVWLGVDGWGGAGKTTLAARIAARLPSAVVVHVDDFASPEFAEWDWDRMERELVAPLRAGRPARYQVWGWDHEVGGEWVEVVPGVPVIVEGVSATRREVRADWAFTCWVDAPLAARLDRARERDGADLLPRWIEDWVPSEERYVVREDPLARVDLVVDGIADALVVTGGVATLGARVVGRLAPGGEPDVDPAFRGWGIEARLRMDAAVPESGG